MTARQHAAASRALAATAVATASVLALSGCGIVRDITGTREEPAEVAFPYTREGQIFQDTGQDSTLRFSVTGLERTDEYTVLYYENTYVDHFQGIVTNLAMPNTLVDPVSGQAFWEITDEEGYYYGSVAPTEDGYPVEVGATNQYRRYFPRLPDRVKQITFVGSGLGAMTGIPVVDVEEEQPDPVDPNGATMIEDGPAPGDAWVTDPRVKVATDVAAEKGRRIGTVTPDSFRDARAIGELFRDGVPVIVNLTAMDPADAKRVVDFAAGLIFGLRGSIDRVATRVFLLSPADTQVVVGEAAGRKTGGFFNQS